MLVRVVKLATVAGLVGLAVIHADAFARVVSFGAQTFTNAVNLGGTGATTKGGAK
jgi:hypothetical protein